METIATARQRSLAMRNVLEDVSSQMCEEVGETLYLMTVLDIRKAVFDMVMDEDTTCGVGDHFDDVDVRRYMRMGVDLVDAVCLYKLEYYLFEASENEILELLNG